MTGLRRFPSRRAAQISQTAHTPPPIRIAATPLRAKASGAGVSPNHIRAPAPTPSPVATSTRTIIGRGTCTDYRSGKSPARVRAPGRKIPAGPYARREHRTPPRYVTTKAPRFLDSGKSRTSITAEPGKLLGFEAIGAAPPERRRRTLITPPRHLEPVAPENPRPGKSSGKNQSS